MDNRFPLALPKGSVIGGQYIIDCVIGQGKSGFTYQVHEYRSGRRFAIREYFPADFVGRKNDGKVALRTDGNHSKKGSENLRLGISSFMQEAQTLARWNHIDGIFHVICYFEDNGTAYYVLESMEGVNLADYITNKVGPMKYADAETVLGEVMESVILIHDEKSVHGGIYPAHIYLTGDCNVKLLDSTADKYMDYAADPLLEEEETYPFIRSFFLAPANLAESESSKYAADIYMFAATFFYITTKKLLQGLTPVQVTETLMSASKAGDYLSTDKAAVLNMVLNNARNGRFKSVKAFRDALRGNG